MNRIGLMGGTFDPVHHGHLSIASQALHEWNLDRVIFIPAKSPPHKRGRAVTDAEHRYLMVELAIAGHPGFFGSRLELERAGDSFTVDTLRHFNERGCDPDRLFFIVGADSVLELLTWHRHDEVIRRCTLLAAARPGFDLGKMDQQLPAAYRERIRVLHAPGLEVSGSELRERVRRGQPVRYLVPEPVDAYIAKHRLYREG
jgi:nicotinate-nucleotide adenylyltransferase